MRAVNLLIIMAMLLFYAPAFATDIQEIKTKNGYTAWLVEEHSQPLVSVSIVFRNSGTAYDPDGKEGLASMVSAMLLEGAGDMNVEEFTVALENHAIRMTFSADEDNFYGGVESLSEYKKQAFYYLSLALLRPRFEPDSLERIKRQTLTAIKKQLENPYYLLNQEWQKNVFADHPYAKPEIGTEESIKNIGRKDLSNFINNYLSKENIVISVVGDITAKELAQILEQNFNALPESYKADKKIADISTHKPATETHLTHEIPQTIIQFGMEGLKRSDKDYIIAHVMNHILGGGTLTSRLNKEIRLKRGLTYSASSLLYPLRHSALLVGWLSTRNEKAEETISVLKQTLSDLAENGVSEDELARAKNYLIGNFIVSLDSNNSIAGFLSTIQLYNLGIDYIDKRNKLIESITSEQINEMAKRLIKMDGLQIVTIGQAKL